MAKVLIVDDDAFFAEKVAKHLAAAGHATKVCPNGREALAEVLTALPVVVVLDLIMPEMDGPSFLEVVRSYLRLQTLPVVVVTGVGDSPMLDRARHLKVNSILAKERASLEEIRRAVDEAVARVPG